MGIRSRRRSAAQLLRSCLTRRVCLARFESEDRAAVPPADILGHAGCAAHRPRRRNRETLRGLRLERGNRPEPRCRDADGMDRGLSGYFRSGKLRWTWDPIPWAKETKPHTGAGNAWSTLSVDSEHDLVFIPTGSAAPDYFGGLRAGDNKWANSVVALRAST